MPVPFSLLAASNFSIHQHTSAYVSIWQHTAAYVSIRQDTYDGTFLAGSLVQLPEVWPLVLEQPELWAHDSWQQPVEKKQTEPQHAVADAQHA